MRYYYSGLPYSDSLYHHGINGMKWGQRRYQNPDGSLTALGRVHYGVGKAREKIGEGAKKAAKATGRAALKAIKKRFPSLMTDDELREAKARLDLERSYRQVKEEINSKKFLGRTKKAVEDIVYNSSKDFATNVARNAASKAAARLLENKYESNTRSIIDKTKDKLARATKDLTNKSGSLLDVTNKISDIDKKISEASSSEERAKLQAKKDKLLKRQSELDREIDSLENTISNHRYSLRYMDADRGGGKDDKGNQNNQNDVNGAINRQRLERDARAGRDNGRNTDRTNNRRRDENQDSNSVQNQNRDNNTDRQPTAREAVDELNRRRAQADMDNEHRSDETRREAERLINLHREQQLRNDSSQFENAYRNLFDEAEARASETDDERRRRQERERAQQFLNQYNARH